MLYKQPQKLNLLKRHGICSSSARNGREICACNDWGGRGTKNWWYGRYKLVRQRQRNQKRDYERGHEKNGFKCNGKWNKNCN